MNTPRYRKNEALVRLKNLLKDKESSMNKINDLSETDLVAEDKAAVEAFCEALRKAPNVSIRSITLYGSAARKDYRPGRSDINLLVVVEHIDVSILKSFLDPVTRGRRYGIAPFFITETNLRSSVDVFPVKFLAIKESYKLLCGQDVLKDLEISREHIRLRCEQQIKNILLRMRHQFLIGGGRGRSLTEMMSRVIVAFLETLRIVLSLTQEDMPSRGEVVNAAAETFDLDAETLRNVRALRDRDVSLSRAEAEQLFDKFMAIVDRVAQIADKMA
jgi:predicted nucleotidyltransferase